MLDLDASEQVLATGTVAFAVSRDILDIAGPDAAGYLQGQLSQDAEGLEVGASRAALLLQPQGRVDAWGRLTRLADQRFWFDVDPGHGAEAAARLRRFLLRVEVTIELSSRPLVAVRGRGAPDPAGAAALAVPPGATVLAPVWPGVTGVDVVLGVDDGPWSPAGVELGAQEALEAERIALGLPAMGTEIDGSTIPAAAGVVGASVDFTKGCYVGQELVARIDSRGAATPTRLVGVRFGGPPAAPGSELTADGAPVGTVTSSAPSGRWGPIGLAYLKRGVELGPVDVTAPDGSAAGKAETVALPLAAAPTD